MERVKRRKLKFPCLFGGSKKIPRCKTIQSSSSNNATTEQSLFESEVENNTSKLAKGISNEISSKHPSPNIVAKLMGIGVSSYEDLQASHVADQHNSLQSGAKMKSQIKEMITVKKNHDDVLWETNDIESKRHKPDSLFLKHLHDQKGKTAQSGHVSLFENGYCGEASLTGYGSKSVPSRITFHQNDRLIHSLSNISERSLINEANNRMLEIWKRTRIQNGVETVSKCTTLGEILSFPVKEISIEDEADEKEVVYSEPVNQDRSKGHNALLNLEADIPSKDITTDQSFQPSQTETEAYLENDVSAKRQLSITDIDENSSNIFQFQLTGPGSEYCESLKEVDQSSQFSLLEVPSDNNESDSDCFERLNYQLQELKKQLHLLKVESSITSNDVTLTPKVKHLSQQSSITIPESLDSSIYEIDPDTFAPPYKTIHHPKDSRLFYRLHNYYFTEEIIPRPEKLLFYDYIQQTFIRTCKLMVTYPWVSPEKRESQLTLTKFSLDDQIHKVINEIEKDDDEDFFAIYYDKDPEWLHPTNEVDILGKLISELVLQDLVLEVI